MSTVTIGCRLPSGLIIDLEKDGKIVKSIELEGQRQLHARSKIIILGEEDYGTTEVDAADWEHFKKQVGEEFAPLVSGAIFEAKNEKDAKAKAKELKKEKTGHEPMAQEDNGIESV